MSPEVTRTACALGDEGRGGGRWTRRGASRRPHRPNGTSPDTFLPIFSASAPGSSFRMGRGLSVPSPRPTSEPRSGAASVSLGKARARVPLLPRLGRLPQFPRGAWERQRERGMLGPRDFLPLSGNCKDAPTAKAERGSETSGEGAPSVGGSGSWKVTPPRVLAPVAHGILEVPLRPLLGNHGVVPFRGGTPLMEGHGTRPREGSSTRFKGPAGAGGQIPSRLGAPVYPSVEWAQEQFLRRKNSCQLSASAA